MDPLLIDLATVFMLGVTPIAFFTGFLGIVALAHDACRFVLTEPCITRLQQLILETGRVRASLALPAGSPMGILARTGDRRESLSS